MTDLLKQLRPEMTSLLDCFSIPAVLLCSDYSVLAANQAYRRTFGDGKPLQGRRCAEIMAEAGFSCHQSGNHCPLDTCQQTGVDQHVVHTHSTGNTHIDLYPIRNERAEVVYFLELLNVLPDGEAQAAPAMVGQSAAWREMVRLIRRVAPGEASVLLLGESGTGKELAAAAVHQASTRHHGPFVTVDCSGLPETLFESELFGHEKGAFTGAHSRKIGLVEAANGGSLFLDEVGDIPLSLQVKLLRLLETGTFRRVGGIEPLRSQFRLISATHRNLEKMVTEERFRQDLYYRINTFPITLPALRERLDDIPLLAEAMLQRIPVAKGLQLHPETLQLLERYAFPGNIRELRNILERAALLADEQWILPQHLPPVLQPSSSVVPEDMQKPPGVDALVPLAELEAQYLRWARSSFPGDRRSLAARLGVSERTLYRKLDALKEEHSHE
ncbi:Fis family transcriptional regulator [Acidithiobacillus marinus]|uniref:Fis family transcriptional regulator n=1 Tax=Acidithiobacillus marinus TaxID=187490 RepID=A0A2I1DMN6_9PROT|nr:sigma 54-interacting transcriptional regulator [Acidithiobacillus marinus]PKY11129.1 Fis family transcriptional regulator [Acidithiobacillus marinus]